MPSPYDRVNPVTGRRYGEEFSSAPGNPGQNFGTGWNPTTFTPTPQSTNPMREVAKEQVYSGADFTQYQNQLKDLMNKPLSVNQVRPSAGFEFAKRQGQQAIERRAAAGGYGASGNVLAELAKYTQGLASQDYERQADKEYERAMSERQNKLNMLSELMRGAQQFGLQSGYYTPRRENLPFGMTDTTPSWY